MPTIVPKDAADRERLRVALLEAAGDQPERVQYDTSGPALAFNVDDELVAAISGDDSADDDHQGGSAPATVTIGDVTFDTSEQDPPDRNATTEEWAEFMAKVSGADPVEGKTRTQLIANWDQLNITE
jgi:hypothetical protein